MLKKSASRFQLYHECLHNLICPCMMFVSVLCEDVHRLRWPGPQEPSRVLVLTGRNYPFNYLLLLFAGFIRRYCIPRFIAMKIALILLIRTTIHCYMTERKYIFIGCFFFFFFLSFYHTKWLELWKYTKSDTLIVWLSLFLKLVLSNREGKCICLTKKKKKSLHWSNPNLFYGHDSPCGGWLSFYIPSKHGWNPNIVSMVKTGHGATAKTKTGGCATCFHLE